MTKGGGIDSIISSSNITSDHFLVYVYLEITTGYTQETDTDIRDIIYKCISNIKIKMDDRNNVQPYDLQGACLDTPTHQSHPNGNNMDDVHTTFDDTQFLSSKVKDGRTLLEQLAFITSTGYQINESHIKKISAILQHIKNVIIHEVRNSTS